MDAAWMPKADSLEKSRSLDMAFKPSNDAFEYLRSFSSDAFSPHVTVHIAASVPSILLFLPLPVRGYESKSCALSPGTQALWSTPKSAGNLQDTLAIHMRLPQWVSAPRLGETIQIVAQKD
jgi:hypothetical protein